MEAASNIIDKNWKALIKPNKLEITSNDDKSVAKVVAEPLEKGFGQTIGNSLRRILKLLKPIDDITNVSFSNLFGTKSINLPSTLLTEPIVEFSI